MSSSSYKVWPVKGLHLALVGVILSCDISKIGEAVDSVKVQKSNILVSVSQVSQLPPNARTPVHAQALALGGNIVDDLALSLNQLKLTSEEKNIIVKGAQDELVRRVSAFVIEDTSTALTRFLKFLVLMIQGKRLSRRRR